MLPLLGAAVGALGSIGSAAAGTSMPGDAFAPTAVTFGSVNFKSAGAGDRGKSANATQGEAAAASPLGYDVAEGSAGPAWFVPAAALALLALGVALLWARRRAKARP
jgi:MYXO-CTERM domain-containing protein